MDPTAVDSLPTPSPVAGGGGLSLFTVTDARVLRDGRVMATIVIVPEYDPAVPQSYVLMFVWVDDRWLIDNLVVEPFDGG